MYRLGKRKVRQHKRLSVIAVCLLLLIGGSIFVAKNSFKANTSLGKQPATLISTVSSSQTAVKHFDEPTFGLELPVDWQETTQSIGHSGQYSWQNTSGDPGERQLTIYEDAIPATMAVNRYLALTSEGNHVALLGNVSDNCVDFTQASAVNPNTKTAPAKWQNVDFICDAGNYERDVVGSGSTSGINTTVVQGSSGKLHSFFFVYTDNSSQPDYSIFTNALLSLAVK